MKGLSCSNISRRRSGGTSSKAFAWALSMTARGQRVEQVDVARDPLLVGEGGVGRLASPEPREKGHGTPPLSGLRVRRGPQRQESRPKSVSAGGRAATCSPSRSQRSSTCRVVSSSEPAVSMTTSAIARRASSETCDARRAAASDSVMPRSSTRRRRRTSAGAYATTMSSHGSSARASTSSGTS